MCGIVGMIAPINGSAIAGRSDQDNLDLMLSGVIHRGPNSADSLADTIGRMRLQLGHRRLSIQDLSSAGDQPMTSADGRFTIVFNGEIYNFEDLRAELSKRDHLRSRSDTEVLLEYIAEYGVERTLSKAAGMFAFALVDRKLATLVLARDIAGEKPLYYGQMGPNIFFASELKPIFNLKLEDLQIDHAALQLFFQNSYIPAPYCILRGFRKLRPGHLISIDLASESLRLGKEQSYWQLPHLNPAGFSAKDAVAELEQLLTKAVRSQLVADVPVGTFLSGGIDSSLITALAVRSSSKTVQTFSIGFNDKAHNEAPYAKAVAKYLGTDHTEFYLQSRDLVDLIPSLANIYDEPFADSSQLPTIMVCRLAKDQVSVALSGDGGDELFGGYTRYEAMVAAHKWSSRIPAVFASLGTSIFAEDRAAWRLLEQLNLPKTKKLRKWIAYFHKNGADKFYDRMCYHWHSYPALASPLGDLPLLEDQYLNDRYDHPAERYRRKDFFNYLQGDILTKVDRAAMSASLEARAPFLDRDLIEFAYRIPMQHHMSPRPKELLRRVLSKYIPDSLVDRPKSGFAVPLADWLRGPLKDWAIESLSKEALPSYLNAESIGMVTNMHLSGKADLKYLLWDILIFQQWRRRYFDAH